MSEKRKIVGIWPSVTDGGEPAAAAPAPAPAAEAAVPVDPVAQPVPDAVAEPIAPAAEWLDSGQEAYLLDAEYAPPRPSRWPVMLAVLAITGWTGFVAWLASGGFTRVPALADAPMIAGSIAAPAAVVLMLLLLHRLSFGRAVSGHEHLVARVEAANRSLSATIDETGARWAEAQQAMEMQAQGWVATSAEASERLSRDSAAIAGAMRGASQASQAISLQGENATRAMDALLVALPKIDEVATRVGDTLRSASQSAYQHGSQLEAQVATLSGEGVALGELTAGLAERVEAIRTTSDSAIAAIRAAVDDLVARTSEQSDSVADGVSARIATAAAEAQAAIAAQVGAAGEQAERLTREAASLADAMARIEAESQSAASAIGTAASDSTARVDQMAASTAALDQRLTALTSTVDGAGTAVAGYAERAEALAGLTETLRADLDTDLPQRVDALRDRIAQMVSSADALPQLAQASGETVAAMVDRLREGQALLDAQQAALRAGEASMATMAERVTAIAATLQTLAQDDSAAAADSLRAVAETAGQSAETARAAIADVISQSRHAFEQQVTDALSLSANEAVEARLAAISAAADQAVQAATAASDRLMRQLITIADASKALEDRAAEVNVRVENAHGETLARQMSVLTEALQSNAVDLTRLLDVEVADQSWEQYLKGDRSIFARRTLRLLNASEAKTILRRYSEEEDFRSLVNRYIHDFEAMLRAVMDRRDGQQLSVTLLSSDVGKIYVALAQSIERLRN